MVDVLNNLKIDISREAILVLLCDIQDKYIENIYKYKLLLSSAVIFAEFCSISNLNVYISEQNAKVFGHTCKEIIDKLQNPIIKEKSQFSMLSDDQINNEYENTQYFILFGIEAHICVFQTAVKLLSHKRKVIIIRDCTSSNSKNERELALKTLENLGVVMISLKCLIMLLLEDSKHTLFKKTLPLIKALISLNNELV